VYRTCNKKSTYLSSPAVGCPSGAVDNRPVSPTDLARDCDESSKPKVKANDAKQQVESNQRNKSNSSAQNDCKVNAAE
jgi:hypothetical protein